MSDIKERIAAIDAFGRELAAKANGAIVDEGLVGCSAATIRRVEEIVKATIEDRDLPTYTVADVQVAPTDFEFQIMRGGITSAPLVVVARYLGRVA